MLITCHHLDSPSAFGLNHINEVVNGGVAPNRDVGRVDAVLAHDGLDLVVVNVRERLGAGDVEAALVLLPKGNVGRLLVDADAEALELGLDDSLVRQRLVDVEHDEDEVARLGDGDDLTTSSAAVLGSLNDTGEIDDLQGGACRPE